MKKSRWLVIILWAVGIMFPMAWVGTQNVHFNQFFNALFSPTWMHIGMHTFLYAVLAALLAWVFTQPARALPIGWILAGVCGVAAVQEGFQAYTAGTIYWPGILFDLATDLNGAALGILVYSGIRMLGIRRHKD